MQLRSEEREAVRARRAREAFTAERGESGAQRRLEQIRRLPRREWRGRTVYRVTCQADFGRGPHEQYVPMGVLWALIDLEAYRCPFHR